MLRSIPGCHMVPRYIATLHAGYFGSGWSITGRSILRAATRTRVATRSAGIEATGEGEGEGEAEAEAEAIGAPDDVAARDSRGGSVIRGLGVAMTATGASDGDGDADGAGTAATGFE